MRNVTKWAGTVDHGAGRSRSDAAGRSSNCATAAPGRCWWKCRWTCSARTRPKIGDTRPSYATRVGPDPADVERAAEVLAQAERPVIYAGQGVHYAEAWDALRAFAEEWQIPVTTSLEGKSAFNETHPLALGSGGRANPRAVKTFLAEAGRDSGRGMQFRADRLRRADAARQNHHPRHARPDGSQQGRGSPTRPDRRRPAHADGARRVHGGPRSRPGRSAPRRHAATHRQAEGRVAGRVARQARAQRSAHQPLSRAARTAPGGGHRQHRDHPRRRQPARPALAVLGIHHAALLHRLGQDDSTRLRPGPRHGRQGGAAGKKPASTCGATPPSASPAWTSRRRRASAFRFSPC